MLDRLFGRRETRHPSPVVPAGTRVYAIGDIHGRADLLSRLHAQIIGDATSAARLRRVIVYLGDFVDRGAESRRVIDMLLDETPAGFQPVHLSGNHEELMQSFLEDAGTAPVWMANGGAATLASYGVRLDEPVTAEDQFLTAQREFRVALPERHRSFLRRLAVTHVEGDYLFVHAGIMPGRPLDAQSREHLLWIRDPFLNSTADHGCCVVHGHTIVPEPDERPNRIAIDTGAYFSNRLTCLVLEGESRRYLQS